MTALELAVRAALGKLMVAFRQDIEDVDQTVAVYIDALRDLDPIDISGGTQRTIRGERFFPRPAILRGYAMEERTARTVTVRPIAVHDDTLCSLCGSTKRWLRPVQQPEPDPRHWTQAAINRGEAKAHAYSRDEVQHEYDCPLRRPDQPGAATLTRDAA